MGRNLLVTSQNKTEKIALAVIHGLCNCKAIKFMKSATITNLSRHVTQLKNDLRPKILKYSICPPAPSRRFSHSFLVAKVKFIDRHI